MESPEEEVDTKLEYVFGSETADRLVRLVKADTKMGVCLSALNTVYAFVLSVSNSLERLWDENF